MMRHIVEKWNFPNYKTPLSEYGAVRTGLSLVQPGVKLCTLVCSQLEQIHGLVIHLKLMFSLQLELIWRYCISEGIPTMI